MCEQHCDLQQSPWGAELPGQGYSLSFAVGRGTDRMGRDLAKSGTFRSNGFFFLPFLIDTKQTPEMEISSSV
jgi:hypothetical protein